MILTIISGAQTGVDRAALDFAIENGIPYAGWIPADRKAEDGKVPDSYKMWLHPMIGYPARTESNVTSSDATLIFTQHPMNDEPGCLLTAKLCLQLGKPWMTVSLKDSHEEAVASRVIDWLSKVKHDVLNVAGTRGSMEPNVGRVKRLLGRIYDGLGGKRRGETKRR